MADNNQSLVKSFHNELERLKPQIHAALPKHMNPDRMARIAMTEFRKNPALLNCEPRSVLAAIIMASQLGLEPGVMGQCYFVPYGKECTFIPGWQGYVDLVSRTGRASVWTGAVREGDSFDYRLGSSPKLEHTPSDDDSGNFTHVYAVGWVNGAQWPVIEVWSRAKVLKHLKQYNKVGNKHYANQNENNLEMYGRKVALLQVLKYMPKSVELTVVSALDNAAGEGKQGITIEGALEKSYDGPPQQPEESDEERELRESCEQILQKQGRNQAQVEAAISQNKGKLDQLLARLQREEKQAGGGNGNASGTVGGNGNTRARGAVVEMGHGDSETSAKPAAADRTASAEAEGSEPAEDRASHREEQVVTNRGGRGKQPSFEDWTV